MEMWALPVDALAFSIFHFDRGVLVLCPGGLSRLGWVLRSSYGHILEQAVSVVVRLWLLGLDSFHVLYIGLACMEREEGGVIYALTAAGHWVTLVKKHKVAWSRCLNTSLRTRKPWRRGLP